MAQLDLFTKQPNHNSLYKDINAVRTTEFNKNTPSNELKENNVFQCTYFRSQCRKASPNRNPIKHNQTLSDYSYDSIKTKSDNVSNVLRWLRSLPSNFMINDLNKNMNYSKLSEKTGDLHRYGGNRSKSLGSSLKSADGVPLKGKGITFSGNKQKVSFVDKLDSTRSSNTKKKLANNKRYKNSASRLSKKCGKSDLTTNARKSQQSSLNNNQYQKPGILKDTSEKSIASTSQHNTIEKQIASNRRLLYSIKEIINTVDNDNRNNQVEPIKKDNNIKKNEKTVSMPSNANATENSTKKPFLKNPAIEKQLDNAMRNTLKRYIRSNTWDDFQENNNINGEPLVKKEKRVIPSLAPVNSFHMDLGHNWNANLMLNNFSSF